MQRAAGHAIRAEQALIEAKKQQISVFSPTNKANKMIIFIEHFSEQQV
jgi:hypothetical protein